MKKQKRVMGVFNRVIRAYDENRPLMLRPGDVMMLRHVFAEMDIKSQNMFEILAAYGGRKYWGGKKRK